ncbi:14646_t:CDS:2 [Funneliformis geosporum]|nr:14646_t:CDS:2 [Funneliformis geosporum]
MLITEEPKVVSVEDCSISEDAVEICYSTRSSSINWSFFVWNFAMSIETMYSSYAAKFTYLSSILIKINKFLEG